MNKYTYQAVNHQSEKISGVINANSQREAARTLDGKGLLVINLEVFKVVKTSSLKHGKLKAENINLALHELATMLLGGVSIAEAVDAQAESSHHPNTDLRHGKMFAEALQLSGLPLPAYVIQLLKAGEMTGTVGQSLKDGVAQMTYDLKLKSEMTNALIYPAILVFSGIGAVLMMFIFVVPKFAGLLDDADKIPFLGYMVLAVGVWTNEHWLMLAVILAALVTFFVSASKNQKIRLLVLGKLAQLPLIGDWLIEAEIASWSKVLSALLGNKVPLIQALGLAGESVKIPFRKVRLSEVIKEVKGGNSLSKSLENQQIMTATGCNLVRVGEKSGELPKMLSSLAELYDETGKNRMKKVLALIEPIAILLIGGVIGVIIMGIILAITSANDIVV